MITKIYSSPNVYFGLSTDVKPSGKGLNGSFFVNMDDGKRFIYDEENDAWREI